MSTDDPIVRPNLMHLGGAGGGAGMGRGMGHGGGCGCGGHGHASRDFVTIEPITVEPTAQKVTQPEVVA